MKSRVLVVVLFALALVLPALPAEAAPVTVPIQDMQFTKKTVRVSIGTKVIWKNRDTYQHTTTSNQDFWASPTLSNGDRYDVEMASAGTFAYHCTIHSGMHAKIRVGMRSKGAPRDGWRVRWSTNDVAPVGRNYDVQYKKKGTKGWNTFRNNTLQPSAKFNPRKDGTYLLRGRTSNTNNDKNSGWSPTLRVKIS